MDTGNLKKAMKIYNLLIKQGQINLEDEREIRTYYEDDEIKKILEIVVVESETNLFLHKNTLYLVPEIGNKLLSYDNLELKATIFPNSSTLGVYLLHSGYYIIVTFLSYMYQYNDNNISVRPWIGIDSLMKLIGDSLSNFMEESSFEQIENELNFNISTVAKFWIGLTDYKDEKNLRGQKSKVGIIENTMLFLQKNQLVIVNDEQIRTTDRLNDIVRHYYAKGDREYIIMKLLEDKLYA